MARTSKFTVVTNRNDASIVKMFSKLEEAQAFVGPEYDKKGYVVTTFEKKTETFFSVVEDETESPLSAWDREELAQEERAEEQRTEDRRARQFVRE